jgi:hypothetical protein
MNAKQNIIAEIEKDERWDTGELGRDEDSARPVAMTAEEEAAIDDAAGLQMISIRLPKGLIENFKYLGDIHGIRYQALMRQTLARFADAELKQLARKKPRAHN